MLEISHSYDTHAMPNKVNLIKISGETGGVSIHFFSFWTFGFQVSWFIECLFGMMFFTMSLSIHSLLKAQTLLVCYSSHFINSYKALVQFTSTIVG